MTDREQIIAAAKEAGLAVFQFTYISLVTPPFEDVVELKSIERFWQIAFEAGRQAERESVNLDDGTIDWRGENEV